MSSSVLTSEIILTFVSYAGVSKIASLAEEIENPDRNLSLGILISMGALMVLYTLVVAAVVGLNDSEVLSTSGPGGGPSLTPMADGAGQLWGVGVVVIAVVAILALTSMANAGVLASNDVHRGNPTDGTARTACRPSARPRVRRTTKARTCKIRLWDDGTFELVVYHGMGDDERQQLRYERTIGEILWEYVRGARLNSESPTGNETSHEPVCKESAVRVVAAVEPPYR